MQVNLEPTANELLYLMVHLMSKVLCRPVMDRSDAKVLVLAQELWPVGNIVSDLEACWIRRWNSLYGSTWKPQQGGSSSKWISRFFTWGKLRKCWSWVGKESFMFSDLRGGRSDSGTRICQPVVCWDLQYQSVSDSSRAVAHSSHERVACCVRVTTWRSYLSVWPSH